MQQALENSLPKFVALIFTLIASVIAFAGIDALVGRVLQNGWVASLEGSVPIIKDYPVYDYKIEGRVHFSY